MTTPAAHGAKHLQFRLAANESEMEQIHRLNHRTFVEEIPQHAPTATGRLVDKFDRENTYIVAAQGDRVVGMVAIRFNRPFSLDGKLPDLDKYLPPHHGVCEVRLLAVEPEWRVGAVFRGLIEAVDTYAREHGVDTAVISGTLRQLKLYRHMGFVPFGPVVGSPDAPYQPMYLTRPSFRTNALARIEEHRRGAVPGQPPRMHVVRDAAPEVESFLPGPVPLHPDVWAAFVQGMVSHRHPDFLTAMHETRQLLCGLVGAPHVQVMVGTGTLANDAVAAQLARLATPGLVVSNGEFGERLVDHAARMGLVHSTLRTDWGAAVSERSLADAIGSLAPGSWCWMVHCESSTGVLNDLAFATQCCERARVRLAVDCVSSIGATPVDLRGVFLASGASGKAVAALPGLALVFHDHPIESTPTLPRYLDVGYYAAHESVPFTHSSNLVSALRVAAARTVQRAPFTETAALGAWLRAQLRERGFTVLAPEAHAAPGITTLTFDSADAGIAFGDRLAAEGFELSYRSAYLRQRSWVQVALMGEGTRDRLQRLLDAMSACRDS